ncbi:MAG: radical SAM family heme chaperone HemW [Candidatus Dormibacteria bacterium]
MPGVERQQSSFVKSRTHRASVGDPASLRPRSLYLHIPFCVSKCPYCDFNSHVGLQHLYGAYASALVGEIGRWGRELEHAPLETVFIGGGTPSLVPADAITAVLDAVRASFELLPGAEVTLEANPQSAEAARIDEWLEAGVNRLSLGIQSLDDPSLRFLERAHDAAEALEVMRMARRAGFKSVSFDFIFAIPGLSLGRWGEVLEMALEVGPDHLSAYELTAEEGTRLGADVAARRTVLPGDDERIAQYELAGDLLGKAGLKRYEVSNWSRPGHQCRHNLAYWSGAPYAAAGAGAHAFALAAAAPSWLGGAPPGAVTARQWNVASPAAYIAASRKGESTVGGSEWLDLPTTAADLVMMGLRLDRGLDLEGIESRVPGFGRTTRPVASRLEAAGLLERCEGRLRATERGRAVLNPVVAEFLPA